MKKKKKKKKTTPTGTDAPLVVDLGVVLALAGRQAEVLGGLRAGHVVAVDGHVAAADEERVLAVAAGLEPGLDLAARGRPGAGVLVALALALRPQAGRAVTTANLAALAVEAEEPAHLAALAAARLRTLIGVGWIIATGVGGFFF